MASANPRLRKEILMLSQDPGPGISCWPSDTDNIHNLTAQIQGPEETPYAGGVFTLSVEVPPRYPFEPPRVRFTTPIYHPNIDSDGRICLDTLKMQPQGSWSPSINLNTLLLTIRVLLEHPNPDDGLVPDITELFRKDYSAFYKNAVKCTMDHAMVRNVLLSKNETENNAIVKISPGRVSSVRDEKYKDAGVVVAGEKKETLIQNDEESEDENDDDDDDDDDDDKEHQSDISVEKKMENLHDSKRQRTNY